MSAKWFGKGSQNSNLPLHHEEEMVGVYLYFYLYIYITGFSSPKPIVEGKIERIQSVEVLQKVFNVLAPDHLHITI